MSLYYLIDPLSRRLLSGPHVRANEKDPVPIGAVFTDLAPPDPGAGEAVYFTNDLDWELGEQLSPATSFSTKALTEDDFRRLWTGMERMELDRFADQSAKAVADGTASENQALFHTMWRDTMAAGRAGAIDLSEPYAIEGLDRIAAMPELPGISDDAITHVKAGIPAALRPAPEDD